MSTIQENVTLEYKNDRIKVRGKKVQATLSITADQLKWIYFGNLGNGKITLDVLEEPK